MPFPEFSHDRVPRHFRDHAPAYSAVAQARAFQPDHLFDLVFIDLTRGAEGLSCGYGFFKAHLGPPAGRLPFLISGPRHEASQYICDEGFGRIRVRLKPRYPGSFVWCKGPYSYPPGAQVPNRVNGVQPAPANAVSGNHNQGVTCLESGVQRPPASAAVGAGPSGDADVSVNVGFGNGVLAELVCLGLGVTPRGPFDALPAGPDVSKDCHAGTIPLSD